LSQRNRPRKQRPSREPGGSSKYRRRLLRKSRAQLVDQIIALDGGIIQLRLLAARMALRVGKLEAQPVVVDAATPVRGAG
jgi:hypothetical protein